jgi:hypothetical protein
MTWPGIGWLRAGQGRGRIGPQPPGSQIRRNTVPAMIGAAVCQATSARAGSKAYA